MREQQSICGHCNLSQLPGHHSARLQNGKVFTSGYENVMLVTIIKSKQTTQHKKRAANQAKNKKVTMHKRYSNTQY